MNVFRYQKGERPLDGYTIEYGLGRGGFGEVYFAVSDAGREVALKEIQNYEDIELRGIGHCMNLKSQHLVSIFDVRNAADGTPWVIMEYVSGPSLREILDDSPHGIGPEKAEFFVRELAKGLAYLHNAGVVHRDLKPHNVFFEDGIVKIGDYSLSKVITTSHRSGNTMTVGSVHYMAPEISMGSYDKTVDVYALGIILYEMLTGSPPYTGESMGEVLMKHLSGEPDVSGIAEPYATVICKAMARDSGERYQSTEQLVQDLFGDANSEQRATDFGPASLTMAAGFESLRKTDGRSAPPQHRTNHPNPQDASTGRVRDAMSATQVVSDSDYAEVRIFYGLGRALRNLLIAFGIFDNARPDRSMNRRDPVRPIYRYLLGLFVGLAMISMAPVASEVFQLPEFWLNHQRSGRVEFFTHCVNACLLWLSVFVGTRIARGWILNSSPFFPGLASRVAHIVSCMVCYVLIMVPLRLLVFTSAGSGGFADGIFAVMCISFIVQNWCAVSGPDRTMRVRLMPAIFTGFITMSVSGLLRDPGISPVAIACGCMLSVQAAAVWHSPNRSQNSESGNGNGVRRIKPEASSESNFQTTDVQVYS